MKTLFSAKHFIASLCCFCIIASAFAQEQIVTKKDDLPRHTYHLDIKAVDLYRNDEVLLRLCAEVRRDIESDLERYDIQDKSTLKSYYGVLGTAALNEQRWDDYFVFVEKRKELEQKEVLRLTSGMVGQAIAEAKLEGSDNYENTFEAIFTDVVESLPYEIVQDELKDTKARAEIFSAKMMLGDIEATIQPVLDESGGDMSADLARSLLARAFFLREYVPLYPVIIRVLDKVIKANYVEKENIWPEREVSLAGNENYSEVVIAVWDSGVDTEIFEPANQLWTNEQEIASNGRDDDNNGFIDDVHGIAFDVDFKKAIPLLLPVEKMNNEKLLQSRTKGFHDMQSSIESDEVSELRVAMSNLEQEEVGAFWEELGLYGSYSHGTHVAGIAVEGNPFARILTARITFDNKTIPTEPTVVRAQAEARAVTETVDYFKQNGVRVVNMSWIGLLSAIESDLEANGVGESPEERKTTARRLFTIIDDALRAAIQSAPEILFVAGAGNFNEDVAFNEYYPASYEYPNLLAVGAVDQSGEETSFTSMGKVEIYGNGYEVESFVPGGNKLKLSGSSMSAPQVTNLAAKLLAVKPSLSVSELRELILEGASIQDSGDREIRILNPRKSLELLNAQ